MGESITQQATIPAELAGRRLDQALSELFPDFSRNRLKQWVESGEITVDGGVRRPRDKVVGGEQVLLNAALETETPWTPEAIPLSVIHEDDALIVIDKPAGLVVHPAVGNREGTLVNALLHRYPELAAVPRAGVVHRLDKETSGLLVVARTLQSQASLVEQLQSRSMGREYQAVVHGVLTGGGTVDQPIGRHPVDRKRMAVVRNGKPAVTHYRVVERFRAHTWISVRLETGRTHQIRVHMAHLRYPLVGDPVYGGRLRLPPDCSPQLMEQLQGFRRQALHAARLTLQHPRTGETCQWESPLPADFTALLEALHADNEV